MIENLVSKVENTRWYKFLKRIKLISVLSYFYYGSFKLINRIEIVLFNIFIPIIILLLPSLINFSLFFRKLFYKKNISLLNNIKRTEPLIISLTSFPAKFKSLHVTLWSLLTQSEKPDKLILWLSNDEVTNTSELPKIFTSLQSFGLSIEWVDQNYKSYNKLLFSLKKHPNACIINADDDVVYPKYWLKKLYLEHQKTPHCIIGWRGIKLEKITNTELKPYGETPVFRKITKEPFISHSIYLEGVDGILYPPHSLPEEIHNSKIFLSLCPNADDIWFKAMAIYNNVPCCIINKSKKRIIKVIPSSQNVGLYKINIIQKQNDIQFKKVFDYYNLYNYISD